MSVKVEQHNIVVRRSIIVAFLSIIASMAYCVPAIAQGGAGWELTERTYPTNIAPGGSGLIDIQIFNVGEDDSSGTVTVTAQLPPGLEATEAGELVKDVDPIIEPEIGNKLWNCVVGLTVTCTNRPNAMPHISGGAGGFGGKGPNFVPEVGIKVRARAGATEHETTSATIAGGGALTSASTEIPVTISSSPPAFGFNSWNMWFSNANGTLDTEAGSHPYSATFSFDLNNIPKPAGQAGYETPGGPIRNIEVKLPPGFVGDPGAVSQCTLQELDRTACPADTVVGVNDGTILSGTQNRWLVFNVVPPPGVAAEFAFVLNGVNVLLQSGVRSGSDYGLTTDADNTPQRGVIANVLTLWGVPADPSHDRWRAEASGGCSPAEVGGANCPIPSGTPKPFLTLPTSCAGPQPFSIRANTWQDEAYTQPTVVDSHDSNGTPTGFTGCEHLGFAPAIDTQPDTSDADTPAGLTVEVKPPVDGLETPEGLSSADIQNTTVTLPEGLVINPGQAAGLEACQPWQDGLTSQAEKAAGEEDNGPASCPGASKVGTVAIQTPLLESVTEKELLGNVYVLQSNPPELKLLIAGSADGVNLKLVGTVHLNEQTGRLTTTFEGTPQLPFTDFKLSFSGGAQAALATPVQCGVYTTTADFESWANPFVTDAFPSTSFSITKGSDGGACPPSSLPFSPSLIAGATTDQAGGYTNFSMLLQTPDDQQRISRLQFKAPEGLSGMISTVPLCGEAQANAGTCSSASQIGHATVASGPGPYPLVVPQPGQPPAPIYLTGPYDGAPFGLSIVVPVVVGPFTLQTQIVRAKIEVDPLTAAITVTTNPLPQIIDGVPTDLRTVNAVIDRPGFMFNPTNCRSQEFSGTATSAQGATAPISSHFQMGSCRSLTFKPKFTVSTSGKTSRANGASLTAKIVYPTGPLPDNQASQQSNIASVKVDLPKQLPSRLTTLQKACTAAQFNVNPAGCPAASIVGHATVHTPILPVPLTGPAYFVSHAGEEFPSLIIVLQGYGVTVDLVGTTFINPKTNVTSSTFKSTPDVPFSSFELDLPEGKYSALAATGNLCKLKLTMPTAFTAQNGAVIHQSTPIAATGCPKAKKANKKSKKKKAGHAPAKSKKHGG